METAPIRQAWDRHKTIILTFAIAFMALAGAFRLATEFARLLWQSGSDAAVDLKLRHQEVQRWFDGEPVYGELSSAVYPPASYAMLWPFLGWSSLALARWIWAITSAMTLAGLAYLLVRESKAEGYLERIFVILMLLSMYATGITIGNGQLTIHLLLVLVAGLALMHRDRLKGHADWLVGLLSLAALVKPTLALPFLWLILFVPGRLKPAMLVGLGYAALTLVAIAFQGFDILSLYQAWARRGLEGAAWGSVTGGYANLHSWLALLGLSALNLPSSVFVLLAFGYWTFRYRTQDVWLLFGVTAIVARFWTYHRVYDDLLILLPMIALFRIAKQERNRTGQGVVSGILLALALGTALMPARLMVSPPPWAFLSASTLTIVWSLMLIFLLYRAWYEQKQGVPSNAVNSA